MEIVRFDPALSPNFLEFKYALIWSTIAFMLKLPYIISSYKTSKGDFEKIKVQKS